MSTKFSIRERMSANQMQAQSLLDALTPNPAKHKLRHAKRHSDHIHIASTDPLPETPEAIAIRAQVERDKEADRLAKLAIHRATKIDTATILAMPRWAWGIVYIYAAEHDGRLPTDHYVKYLWGTSVRCGATERTRHSAKQLYYYGKLPLTTEDIATVEETLANNRLWLLANARVVLGNIICDMLAQGIPDRTICRQVGMPRATFYRRLNDLKAQAVDDIKLLKEQQGRAAERMAKRRKMQSA